MSSRLGTQLIWILFFASTIYGRVALKIAIDKEKQEESLYWLNSIFNLYGITACLSWGISCVLWLWILSHHTLLEASSIALIRYLGICLAACIFINESFSPLQMVGSALIVTGVFLVSSY